MADKKISALNSASTPLAGSEVLPIVQSGATVKVSVNNLTEGKFVSVGSLGVNTSSLLGGAIAENRQNVDANYSDTFTTGTTRNHLVLRDLSDVGTYSTPFSALAFAAGDSGAAWSAIRNVRLSAQTSALTFATANGSSNPVERMRVDNAGNITAATGNFVVGTAGKGIDFSANANAPGMTSELLGWYEEGAWTPTYYGASGSAGSLAYAEQSGKYTRIGRQVTVTGTIILSDKGSWTGRVQIGGFPFVSSSDQFTGAIELRNCTFTGDYVVPEIGRAGNNFARLVIVSGSGANSVIDDTMVANNSGFLFTLTYFV